MDLSNSHSRNTKRCDQATASELESLLTYFSLCDDRSGFAITRKISGAYFYGQEANNPVETWENINKQAREVTRWRGAFVNTIDPDEPKDDPDDLFELSVAEDFNEDDAAFILRMNVPESELWKYHGCRAISSMLMAITKRGTLEQRAGLTVLRKRDRIIAPPATTALYHQFAEIFWANVVHHLYWVDRRWSVRVRLEQGLPYVGFFTDPTGVLQFLKFREKPDGKNRRDAVIHWVSEHWRKNRNDPDAEINVRRHIRGSEVHRWHGMDVRIIVPEAEEIEVDEKTRRKAKAMKLIQQS